MKIKTNAKAMSGRIRWMLLGLITLCFMQCKENELEQELAYDSSKPVLVTDFSPKEGGVGNNLLIYGDNFGNDISRIKVTIGGQVAKVVGLKNKTVYCIVPSKAYDGDIEVFILDDNEEELALGKSEGVFLYQRKLQVSTFLGKYYPVPTDFQEKEGPFNDCGAFKGITWFSYDPTNKNHLYFTADQNTHRLIDFEKEYVSYFRTPGIDRAQAISWRIDGNKDMVISHNHSSDTRKANYIFYRESKFLQSQVVGVNARGVNGSMIHPQNGELYYSRYRAGDIRRYDFVTQEDKLAFPNPYPTTTMYLIMHPTGDYAYIMESERNYIMRTDYDRINKTFKIPYTVCGAANAADAYADGVGTAARLSNPAQGVFVKNPDYATGGDQYDFYFCDRDNHAIRILTPNGRVSTFAGRGNNGTVGYSDGDLRKEARFNLPTAIAYDEENETFYIGDNGNWLIRKIAEAE